MQGKLKGLYKRPLALLVKPHPLSSFHVPRGNQPGAEWSTYDLMKGYYQDEEEDMAWSDQQLKLIECIGLQNWLIQQL